MNDCVNTTSTVASPHLTSPYEIWFWKTTAGNRPRLHVSFLTRTRLRFVRAQGQAVFLPQQGEDHRRDCVNVAAGLRNVRHVVRPVEQHAACPLAGRPRVKHRGHAGCGGRHMTGDVGPRLEHEIPSVSGAAGVTGAANAIGVAGEAGTAGDTATAAAVNGPDIDGATNAGGDAAVIIAAERQPPGLRGPPNKRATATGVDTCKDKTIPSNIQCGAISRPRTLQPAHPVSANLCC